MLEGALSGPIETKCLMYVNARSMVITDQLGFNRKNLSLRVRATELNCSTKHHCVRQNFHDIMLITVPALRAKLQLLCSHKEQLLPGLHQVKLCNQRDPER